MIRSDSKQDGTGLGGAYAFNALLALWLIVLGDDAYDSSCYDMVMSCSDDSWGYIVDI